MAEFGVATTLVTPAGTLTFNPGAGVDGLHLTDVVGLDGAPIRNPSSDLPQTDGTLLHDFFRSGKKVTLRGYILANAGTTTRRTSEDTLRGYLDRLIRPTATELVSSCRLRWLPSGYSDTRMLDACQLYEPVAISGGFLKDFEFTIASPYPYARDLTETTTTGNATINNTGNATMFPAFKLNSTFTSATIANTTTGEQIVFSAGISSGYIEVDTFRKTAYLNGTGANQLSKMNFATTSKDWVRIVPGNNVLTYTFGGSVGATGDILWSPSWA